MDGVISTPSDFEGSTPHTGAWVRTWSASPQAPDDSVSCVEPFENATLRQIVRISGGGHRIRLRISNEYGTAPLTIGAARIELTDTDDTIRAGSVHPVTFGGRSSATVPVGAPILSDPVDLPTAALSRLSISLYLRTEESAGFLSMFPGPPVGVDDIIAGHLQLAARARVHGVKVHAATIAPPRQLRDVLSPG